MYNYSKLMVAKMNYRDRLWRLLDVAPILIPVWLAVFSFAQMCALILASYNVYSIILGFIVACAASVVVYRPLVAATRTPTKEGKIVLSIVFIFAIIWTGFNALYTAQHLHTNRDPATYLVAGMWLVNNETTQMPASGIMTDVDGVRENSAGFHRDNHNLDEYLQPQGNHLLPILLSVFGKIDERLVYKMMPIFGGLALIAVFGFARLLMRDRWALVAVVALGLSLPLIYFSRDTYTEPLAMTFIFGALSALVLAARAKTGASWLWGSAGLLAGAGALVRIDAPLAMAGVIAGAGLALIFTIRSDGWRALGRFTIFMAALCAAVGVGLTDVYLLSSHYMYSQWDRLWPQYAVLGVELVVILAVALKARFMPRAMEFLHVITKNWRAIAAVVFVIIISLFLASRPLWMESERYRPLPLTERLQEEEYIAEHLYAPSMSAEEAGVINSSRDYAEQTVNWMIWYIGPVLVVLSVIGFSVAAYRAATTRNIIWVSALATIFAVGVLYFSAPNINVDQIWASRRFLPAVIPGIAIFGALGLAWLHSRRRLPFGASNVAVTSFLAAAAVAGPLFVSQPFLFTRELAGQYHQVNDICQNVGKNDAVFYAGHESALNLNAPTRALCGNLVSVFGTQGRDDNFISQDLLSKMYSVSEMDGKQLIVALFSYEVDQVENIVADELTSVSGITYEVYEQTLNSPPRNTLIHNREVLMGRVQSDGSVTPL